MQFLDENTTLFFKDCKRFFPRIFLLCVLGIDENCEVLFIERDDDNRHFFFFVMNDE